MAEPDLRKHNILATFSSESAATDARAALVEAGIDGADVTLQPKDESRAVATAEMRDELEGMAVGPGVVASKSMTRGSLGGIVVGGAVGAIIGLVVGLVWANAGGGETTLKVAIAVLTVGLGGAVFAGVAGGFAKARHDPSPTDPGGSPDDRARGATVVGVHLDDDGLATVAMRTLEPLGPDRLDRFNQAGQVVSTRFVDPAKSDAMIDPPSAG